MFFTEPSQNTAYAAIRRQGNPQMYSYCNKP